MRYWKESVFAFLAYLFISIIGFTLRIKFINREILEDIKKKGKNVVFAFWHGRQFLLAHTHRNQGIMIMTSLSRDGEIQTRTISHLGFSPIRGSSTRGARQALKQMVRRMGEKRDVAFAVDGPQGPLHQVKAGVLFIARTMDRMIVPLTTSARWKKVFERSWDKYMLPLPFSKGVVVYGKPIEVNKGDDIEHKCKELAMALNQLTEEADRRVCG